MAVLAATVLETTSALSLTIATAKYTWAWLDTADMIEIALAEDIKVSCYTIPSLASNIGRDKEQPVRRKNTLLTVCCVCCVVCSHGNITIDICTIKFNVTVTVKSPVT